MKFVLQDVPTRLKLPLLPVEGAPRCRRGRPPAYKGPPIIDFKRLAEYLNNRDQILAGLHNLVVAEFQLTLDELAGQACPTAEGNRQLLNSVNDCANSYGVAFFYGDKSGEMREVRLRWGSAEPRYGQFLAMLPGRAGKYVRGSARWLPLRAGRSCKPGWSRATQDDASRKETMPLMKPGRQQLFTRKASSLLPVADAPHPRRGRPPVYENDPKIIDIRRLPEYLSDRNQILASLHDPVVAEFQLILDELAGNACPASSENEQLAKMIRGLADSYGIAFFYADKGDQLRQVRLRWQNTLPGYGQFAARLTGSKKDKHIGGSVRCPHLKAGRSSLSFRT